MAQANDKYGIVFQNLKDAGFDKITAESYTEMILAEKSKKALQLMKEYRKVLLDNIHTNQKKLDCLDFLVYQIERSAI